MPNKTKANAHQAVQAVTNKRRVYGCCGRLASLIVGYCSRRLFVRLNLVDRISAGIHVYGGDFFVTPRSEWNPQTFEEQPFDVADAMRAFEEANKLLHVREKGTDLFSVRSC